MDKTRKPNLIEPTWVEINLVSLRLSEKDLPSHWNSYYGTDPFILYQEGRISKRKLIKIISDSLMKDCM